MRIGKVNCYSDLLIHQANPASIGVVSSDISFPYRHNPASSLKISRAPRPAHSTPGQSLSFSANSTARWVGTEIYQRHKTLSPSQYECACFGCYQNLIILTGKLCWVNSTLLWNQFAYHFTTGRKLEKKRSATN